MIKTMLFRVKGTSWTMRRDGGADKAAIGIIKGCVLLLCNYEANLRPALARQAGR